MVFEIQASIPKKFANLGYKVYSAALTTARSVAKHGFIGITADAIYTSSYAVPIWKTYFFNPSELKLNQQFTLIELGKHYEICGPHLSKLFSEPNSNLHVIQRLSSYLFSIDNSDKIARHAFLSSACPKIEFKRQMALLQSCSATAHPRLFEIKSINFLICAIIEECIFRKGIQDFLLKKIIVKSSFKDQKIEKVFNIAIRISFSAIIFSVSHLLNYDGSLPSQDQFMQFTPAFVSGVFLGILQETLGLKALISMHVVHNWTVAVEQGFIAAKC